MDRCAADREYHSSPEAAEDVRPTFLTAPPFSTSRPRKRKWSSRQSVTVIRPSPSIYPSISSDSSSEFEDLMNFDSDADKEVDFAIMSGSSSSASLTRPSAMQAKSNAARMPPSSDAIFRFPAWLQSAMQSYSGPSVALVYELQRSPTGAQDVHCLPLCCSYPKRHSFFPSVAHPLDTSEFAYFDYSFNRFFDRYQSSVLPRIKGKLSSFHERGKASLQPVVAPKSSQIPQPTRKPWISAQPFKRTNVTPLDTGKIPVEIFECIIAYLSRNDVKYLRLVDKAFERGVSGNLFNTVVVPFNTEIYGMLSSHQERVDEIQRNCKLKGKARKSFPTRHRDSMTPLLPNGLLSMTSDPGQGLDVFRGFGPHIQRYGMSFEVDEDVLANPGAKNMHQGHETYWGFYNWPYPEYRRFADRAGLELAADETFTMTLAFSNLTSVKHLALSLDSGLGWLKGQDESIRARVLDSPSKIFGRSRYQAEPGVLAQRRLWSMLQYSYGEAGAEDKLKLAELARIKRKDAMSLARSDVQQHWMETSMRLLSAASIESTSNSLNRPRATSMDQGLRPQVISSFPPRGVFHTIAPLQTTAAVQRQRPTPVRGRRRSSSNLTRRYAPSADLTSQPNVLRRVSTPRRVVEFLNDEEIVRPALQGTTKGSRGPGVEGLSGNVSSLDLAATQKSDEDTDFDINDNVDEVVGGHQSSCQCGIIYTRPSDTGSEGDKPRSNSLTPNNLTQAQQEWLLETAWAQDAFLSSYMLSIADNYEIFHNVKSLTISRLSSRHLSKLFRDDFWNSLPSLSTFEIRVIADWRDVQKDHTGCTATPSIEPTSAITTFHYLLATILSRKSTLKVISMGWVEGGEHAEGVRARNKNILPAPIMSRQPTTVTDSRFPDMLVFPYVEELTIVNCWMTPNALTTFIDLHKTTALRKLILESVSMTTHPRFDLQQQGGAAVQALPAALLGQLINLPHGQFAQQAQLAGIPLQQAIQQAIALHQNHAVNPQAGNVFPPQLAHQQANALPQQWAQFPPLPQSQIAARLREGSWPDVLERIKADRILARRTTLELRLLSCGYVRLRQATFDQTALEHAEMAQAARAIITPQDAFFAKRRAALHEFGMTSMDPLLGSLVTVMPDQEMEVLEGTWGFREGWPSVELLGKEYDAEDGWGKWSESSKDAAEFDGARRGGTGRFSGRVENFAAP